MRLAMLSCGRLRVGPEMSTRPWAQCIYTFEMQIRRWACVYRLGADGGSLNFHLLAGLR